MLLGIDESLLTRPPTTRARPLWPGMLTPLHREQLGLRVDSQTPRLAKGREQVVVQCHQESAK